MILNFFAMVDPLSQLGSLIAGVLGYLLPTVTLIGVPVSIIRWWWLRRHGKEARSEILFLKIIFGIWLVLAIVTLSWSVYAGQRSGRLNPMTEDCMRQGYESAKGNQCIGKSVGLNSVQQKLARQEKEKLETLSDGYPHYSFTVDPSQVDSYEAKDWPEPEGDLITFTLSTKGSLGADIPQNVTNYIYKDHRSIAPARSCAILQHPKNPATCMKTQLVAYGSPVYKVTYENNNLSKYFLTDKQTVISFSAHSDTEVSTLIPKLIRVTSANNAQLKTIIWRYVNYSTCVNEECRPKYN